MKQQTLQQRGIKQAYEVGGYVNAQSFLSQQYQNFGVTAGSNSNAAPLLNHSSLESSILIHDGNISGKQNPLTKSFEKRPSSRGAAYLPTKSAKQQLNANQNQRNMVINLSQVKTRTPNKYAMVKQSLSNNGIYSAQGNSSSLDYSQKQGLGLKKNSITRQKTANGHQTISNFLNQTKDSTKRSGTTGGTEGGGSNTGGSIQIISNMHPRNSLQMKGGFSTTTVTSKSASKKRSANTRNTNTIQQQSQRRAEKGRPQSQLGHFSTVSNNITIDFGSAKSREGATGAAGINYKSLNNLTQEKIKLLSNQEDHETIKSTLDYVSGRSTSMLKEYPNSRNLKPNTSSQNHTQPAKSISQFDYKNISRLDIGPSLSDQHSTFDANTFLNQMAQYKPPQNQSLKLAQQLRDSKESLKLLKQQQDYKDIEAKLKAKNYADLPMKKRENFFIEIFDQLNKAQPDQTGLSEILTLVKQGLQGLFSDFHTQLDKKPSNSGTRNQSDADKKTAKDRVIDEMKKQLGCYKQELASIKKMDAYVYAENYQKLVTEYNQLYDHYKGVKQINKRVKLELKNCNSQPRCHLYIYESNYPQISLNERERTFLKLLKKTEEYGPQASQLELEYDLKEDVRLNGGFTLDSLVVDSNERRAMKQPMMEHHGAKDKVVKIPKLDLTSIYIQREAPVSGDKKKDKKGQEEEFTPSESPKFKEFLYFEFHYLKQFIMNHPQQRVSRRKVCVLLTRLLTTLSRRGRRISSIKRKCSLNTRLCKQTRSNEINNIYLIHYAYVCEFLLLKFISNSSQNFLDLDLENIQCQETQ